VGTIDMKETLRNFPIQLTSVREYARQMIVHSVSEGQHNFILGAGRVPEVNEAIEQMSQRLGLAETGDTAESSQCGLWVAYPRVVSFKPWI